ncbi:Nitrite reductase [NAD(P)H] small subunit [hydrothermal vent metagenome]|uniref:Nitrite reductase [NAD(P)H] small subunit n=1 Tax=hydrothermal vent metagenome TaxID=652676 RepID=A0A3B0Z4X4_9ZZZZ
MSTWHKVGNIQDIPLRASRLIQTEEGDVAIFRTSNDDVFALVDRCPHLGGPLSQGIVHGTTVTCPLHQWNIDLKTGEVIAPDEGCAGHIPVKVESNIVYIEL